MHQLQVNKYPNCVDGGNFFQIRSLSGSKITSVVNKRASLNVAKDKIRRWISVGSGMVYFLEYIVFCGFQLLKREPQPQDSAFLKTRRLPETVVTDASWFCFGGMLRVSGSYSSLKIT
jgi:hypothetical protein